MGMRRLGPQVAAVALTVLVCFLGTHSTPTADAQTVPAKPNFVFILADDMREDDLRYMPKTRSLLGGKGTRFDKAYVSLPVCCPARSTVMRGQYAHNTGVWVNSQWAGYKANGNEQDNVATRLDAAGYRTGLFGKYLNGYDGSTIPAGWDRWHAHIDQRYYDYDVNVDGRLTHFGTAESDYSTDVIKRQTRNFIATSSRRSSPFFAYVAPKAPHGPFNGPVPRHQHDFDGAKAPRPPSFNGQDVSDEPPWIRSLPRLTTAQIAAIDERQEGRAESLQALDDLVGGVVNKLATAGCWATPTSCSPRTTASTWASTEYPTRKHNPTRRASTCRSLSAAPASRSVREPASWPSTPTTSRRLPTWRAYKRPRTSTGAPCAPFWRRTPRLAERYLAGAALW
jgi:hypothetical protein